MAQRQTRQGKATAIELPLPASLEAIYRQAKEMLERIDNEKAACFVQQVTNGHADDAPWQPGEDPTSYAERLAFLEGSERKLRDSLPRAVLDRLNAEAA